MYKTDFKSCTFYHTTAKEPIFISTLHCPEPLGKRTSIKIDIKGLQKSVKHLRIKQGKISVDGLPDENGHLQNRRNIEDLDCQITISVHEICLFLDRVIFVPKASELVNKMSFITK